MSNKPNSNSEISKDLRVQRTRKWLQESLIELMKEKPFREIQITEIADRAQVARPTFYLHFRSKEELLLSHFDIVFEELFRDLADAVAMGRYDKPSLCIKVFEYIANHIDRLRLALQAEIQNEIRARLRLYFLQILLHLKAETGKPLLEGLALEMMVDFVSGGALSLITTWINNDMPYSTRQMGLFMDKLTAYHEEIALVSAEK